jgi:hypothetical protein
VLPVVMPQIGGCHRCTYCKIGGCSNREMLQSECQCFESCALLAAASASSGSRARLHVTHAIRLSAKTTHLRRHHRAGLPISTMLRRPVIVTCGAGSAAPSRHALPGRPCSPHLLARSSVVAGAAYSGTLGSALGHSDSVDPMQRSSVDFTYEPGHVYTIHSPVELQVCVDASALVLARWRVQHKRASGAPSSRTCRPGSRPAQHHTPHPEPSTTPAAGFHQRPPGRAGRAHGQGTRLQALQGVRKKVHAHRGEVHDSLPSRHPG